MSGTEIYRSKLRYFTDKQKKFLQREIKAFYGEISKDSRFKKPMFINNERWEFFMEFFKKYNHKIIKFCDELVKENSELNQTHHSGEIHEIIQKEVFLDFAFSKKELFVFKEERNIGNKKELEFEVRAVGMKELSENGSAFNALLLVLDQALAQRIKFYNGHKSLAYIEVHNMTVEPDIVWSFARVNFFSNKKRHYQKDFLVWLGWGEEMRTQHNLEEEKSFAVIKFYGCSSTKALALSQHYFNYVFSCLRLIGELSLRKSYWTSREGLTIPLNKVITIESSHDNWMSTTIMPELDNDFYVALAENSIYLPLHIDLQNIKQIEANPNYTYIQELLGRAYDDNPYEIDKKIFNALSWYSESLENFIVYHKIVGLITSLETLLTGRKMAENITDKGISELFAERGAIIMCDSYEKRIEMRKKLKEMYSLRSEIVHGSGRTLDATKERLLEIQSLAAQVIVQVIKLTKDKNIKSLEELNDFVMKELYS